MLNKETEAYIQGADSRHGAAAGWEGQAQEGLLTCTVGMEQRVDIWSWPSTRAMDGRQLSSGPQQSILKENHVCLQALRIHNGLGV